MLEATAQTQADRVIHRFGGVNATARACRHKNASTVQGWKKRGWIPQRRWPEVLEAARREAVALTERDFIQHLAGGEHLIAANMPSENDAPACLLLPPHIEEAA